MAHAGMTYIGEEEDTNITLVGTSHVHVFANTGHDHNPKVIVDGWTGANPPVLTVTPTQVTIAGADGDMGHVTVINCG